MAQPSQINSLRSTDFPEGVSDKAAADKLFQILNPFLQQVGSTTTAGTSLGQNIDGQFASVDLGKASGWKPMTLTAPFAGNGFTPWPQPSYRIDGTGRLWLRGLFTAASAPSMSQVFWTYPNTSFAPTQSGASGTGRLFAVPFTSDNATRNAFMRLDAGDVEMRWGDGQSYPFATSGTTGWANLTGAGANVSSSIQYRMDSDGQVWLRGNAATTNAGNTQMQLGTLPAGYRPAALEMFAATIQDSTPTWKPGWIQIATNGVVTALWTGAIQANNCPVGHVNFYCASPLTLPASIYYGSLDAISWDTKGGPSLATRPGFPLNIRLKDGKKPVAVLCWAVNKDTNAVEVCTIPGWIAAGAGPTGNQLTITNVADLRDDQAYTLNFFIFF